MVKVKDDLTGYVFGRLTVLEQTDDYVALNGKHYARWLCECSCEEHTKVKVSGTHLRKKLTLSCGCIRKEKLIERNRSRSKTNTYSELRTDEHGNYYIGLASNTNNEFYVDEDDFYKIKNYCWNEHILINGYHRLETRIGKRIIAMSEVLGYKYYDHEDRNTLNNRKYNFRQADSQENNRNHSISRRNTSKVIGVNWNKNLCQWQARIYINKKEIHLGYFNDKEDAIKTRLLAEQKYYKEFAPQRHLFEQYNIITGGK